MINLKNTFFKRLYTGLLGVLLLAICTIYSVEFSLLFLYIWIICAVEYFNIYSKICSYKWKTHDTLKVVLFSIVVSVPLINTAIMVITKKINIYNYCGANMALLYIPIFLINFLWFLAVYKIFNDRTCKMSKFYGSIYIAVPFLSIILIRWIFGWEAILLLFLGVWSMDIFSFTSGMRFGKHPIAPTISPKKTWEGLIGGIIGSIICFLLFQSLILGMQLGWTAYLFSILLPLVAFFGDLFESTIKRRADIKDSSNLLKGHGGIWDRFDSMIFYTIIFSFYLVLVWKL